MGGYFANTGRWVNHDDIAVQPPVTRTATLVGSAVDTQGNGDISLDLAVTAASGTGPTLDVVIETSKDGVTWRSLGAFAQKTAVSAERKSFSGCDRLVRANAVIAGTTPSFTYSVVGEAK